MKYISYLFFHDVMYLYPLIGIYYFHFIQSKPWRLLKEYMNNEKKVAIVGAGISGFELAALLSRLEYKIYLF